MLVDFNKRLKNALGDAGLGDAGVSDLLDWLTCAIPYFERNNHTGAVTVYKIEK